MQIHMLQTGTVAVKQVQVQGKASGNAMVNILMASEWSEPLPIFAFVIEHPEGLMVVDTGETALTGESGYFPWWHPYYRFALREWVEPEEEIGPQMRAIGFDPADVRWVLLTHLHTDHAGGLHHFPKAEHLVSRIEYAYATGLQGRIRGYLPNRWPHCFHPTLIDPAPKALGPFPSSHTLTQAGDVHFIPTPGHTPGHLSVLVQTSELTYFLAGDASYRQDLMLAHKVDGVSNDRQLARETLERIDSYCRSEPTVYLPAHDPDAIDRLGNQRVAVEPRKDESVMPPEKVLQLA
jgi:glyoxylase-like metal-dependent hydrolase (beta-lactamase superfamily II)